MRLEVARFTYPYVIVLALPLMAAAPDAGHEPTVAEKAFASDTVETIAQRTELLSKARSYGWISNTDYERAQVKIGPAFYELDFEVKRNIAFMLVMDGMKKRGRPDFNLVLVDRKTGKTAGRFLTSTWTFDFGD